MAEDIESIMKRISQHGGSGKPFIITSLVQHQIGTIVYTWGAGDPQSSVGIRQPLRVVRESTFEKWQQNLPEGAWGHAQTKKAAERMGVRFYEVVTD